jgi:hypothetical protein
MDLCQCKSLAQTDFLFTKLNPSQLPLSPNNISHQLQPLNRKPLHIPLPITTPRLNLSRHRLPSLPRNSQRNIPRCSIPRTPTRRSRCSTLADRIRAAERLACMLCEPGDDIWGGTFIVFNVLGCPACECYA